MNHPISAKIVARARQLFMEGNTALYIADKLKISYTTAKKLRKMFLNDGSLYKQEPEDDPECLDEAKRAWLKTHWNWIVPERNPKRKWKLKTPYHW